MSSGYITTSRLAKIIELPIALAQTELRRGDQMTIAEVSLEPGQTLELRSITLNVIRNLTLGALPVYLNSAFGICHVGLYFGPMLCSPISYVKITTIGAALMNPYRRKTLRSAGTYTVIVANNTDNIDLSVCATGSMKLYL